MAPPLPDSLFGWIGAVVATPEEVVLETVGLDAVMYLRLFRLGALFFAVASFFAFWFGVVWIGQEFGAAWSTLATITALLLTGAFIAGGLMVGSKDGDPKDQIDPDRL